MTSILFAPETRYISETTRMVDIAQACPPDIDCHFMSYGGQYEHFISDAGFPLHRLQPSMTPALSQRMFEIEHLDKIGFLVRERELVVRLKSEMALLEKIKPKAIVTGFIHSTAISSQVFGIPLVWVTPVTLTRPYFEAGLGVWPDVVDCAVTRALPDRLLNWWTNRSTTTSAALFIPFNRQCRRLGLPRFKSFPHMLETGYTLLSDIPQMAGLAELPPRFHYVGPFITRLKGEIPEEIQDLPRDKPIIYFAMGSSGNPEIIYEVLKSFAGTPYQVIAPLLHLLKGKRASSDDFTEETGLDPSGGSAAGNPRLEENPDPSAELARELSLEYLPNLGLPPNVLLTGWLPAHKVNPLADLSIIHGGQGTVYNALMGGAPIVGVGMQPEQEANLECLVRKNIAIRIRKKRVSGQAIQEAVQKMINNQQAREACRSLGSEVAKWDGPSNTAKFLVEKFAS